MQTNHIERGLIMKKLILFLSVLITTGAFAYDDVVRVTSNRLEFANASSEVWIQTNRGRIVIHDQDSLLYTVHNLDKIRKGTCLWLETGTEAFPAYDLQSSDDDEYPVTEMKIVSCKKKPLHTR